MKNHIKNPIVVVVAVIIIISYLALHRTEVNTSLTEDSKQGKISIAASFYTLAEFAKQIGGENIDVLTITPYGTEPHDFEPSPKDILNIDSSHLFIFIGNGFDSWAEKIANIYNNKPYNTLNITKELNLRIDDKITDPHTWTDPVLAIEIIKIIRDNLKLVDPDNAKIYDTNADTYLKDMYELDNRYSTGLEKCEIRDIITSHSAFKHLGNRYSINIIPIAGMSPNQEPSVRELVEIIRIVQDKDIKYIFFEPLISAKLAETIANETKTQMLVLNPLESLTEEEKNENYLSIMYKNLDNLRTALKCI